MPLHPEPDDGTLCTGRHACGVAPLLRVHLLVERLGVARPCVLLTLVLQATAGRRAHRRRGCGGALHSRHHRRVRLLRGRLPVGDLREGLVVGVPARALQVACTLLRRLHCRVGGAQKVPIAQSALHLQQHSLQRARCRPPACTAGRPVPVHIKEVREDVHANHDPSLAIPPSRTTTVRDLRHECGCRRPHRVVGRQVQHEVERHARVGRALRPHHVAVDLTHVAVVPDPRRRTRQGLLGQRTQLPHHRTLHHGGVSHVCRGNKAARGWGGCGDGGGGGEESRGCVLISGQCPVGWVVVACAAERCT